MCTEMEEFVIVKQLEGKKYRVFFPFPFIVDVVLCMFPM